MREIILNNFFMGKSYLYLSSCHSTNQYLKEMTDMQEIKEGTLILTDFQEQGRGQRGSVWESEAGKNLMFSFLLRPKFLLISEQFYLNIIISLAIQDCLQAYLSDVKIKWANDILYNYHKICGVLIENNIQGNHIQQSIIGIGLNVNQVSFRNPNASSLKKELNKEIDSVQLLQKLTACIERRYISLRNGQKKSLKNNYLSKLLGYQSIEYYKDSEGEFEGKIIGIDEFGRLEMTKASQLQKVYTYQFKEVEFLYKRPIT